MHWTNEFDAKLSAYEVFGYAADLESASHNSFKMLWLAYDNQIS
jgi:hypothetical protein